MAIILFVAGDHRIVRQGLCALLRTEPDFRVAGEAADGSETLRRVERLRPDVLVMDLMMPGLGGLETARQVVRLSPRTRIVVLSMHSNEAYVVESLRAGAVAYVLKESGADELIRAVREAAAGRRFLSPAISQESLEVYMRKADKPARDPYETLTVREREVFHLTAEGQSGVVVAERLFISPRTVESHRANLMRKLGLRNHKELIRYAAKRGIFL
ncbi:MAG TPA: DNA-binding response regulator [Planctomycetales bacterium]|jgi:DNA-binding NarL/FixJ family response regulator|nr:DNA-binding response regulator [Planctomycetales bacterium]